MSQGMLPPGLGQGHHPASRPADPLRRDEQRPVPHRRQHQLHHRRHLRGHAHRLPDGPAHHREGDRPLGRVEPHALVRRHRPHAGRPAARCRSPTLAGLLTGSACGLLNGLLGDEAGPVLARGDDRNARPLPRPVLRPAGRHADRGLPDGVDRPRLPAHPRHLPPVGHRPDGRRGDRVLVRAARHAHGSVDLRDRPGRRGGDLLGHPDAARQARTVRPHRLHVRARRPRLHDPIRLELARRRARLRAAGHRRRPVRRRGDRRRRRHDLGSRRRRPHLGLQPLLPAARGLGRQRTDHRQRPAPPGVRHGSSTPVEDPRRHSPTDLRGPAAAGRTRSHPAP